MLTLSFAPPGPPRRGRALLGALWLSVLGWGLLSCGNPSSPLPIDDDRHAANQARAAQPSASPSGNQAAERAETAPSAEPTTETSGRQSFAFREPRSAPVLTRGGSASDASPRVESVHQTQRLDCPTCARRPPDDSPQEAQEEPPADPPTPSVPAPDSDEAALAAAEQAGTAPPEETPPPPEDPAWDGRGSPPAGGP